MKPAIHVLPTVEEIKSRFNYNPETGVVTNKTTKVRKVAAGRIAGCMGDSGYLMVGINRRLYRVHRVAWALYYGEWPTNFIDHINGVRSDNRIANLRQATKSQNSYNSAKRSDNTHGHKGVYLCKKSGRWYVRVNSKNIGRFIHKDDAIAARDAAAQELHGEFYCAGNRK